MKGLWKQGGVAAVAAVACADVGRLSPLCAPGRARRAKLFLYGFALAFAVCTAYIAFSSSGGGGGGGSLPAGDWFGGVFASAAPYRSQISNFFSSMFPTNSSSPSPERRADGGGAARGGGSSSRDVAVKGGGEEGGGVGASRPVGSNNSSTIGSSKVWGSEGGAPSNNAGGGSGSPAGVKDEGGARSSSSASGNSTVPASSSAPAPPSDPLGDGAPMNNSAAGGGASKSGGGDPTGNSAGDGDVGKRGAKDGGVSINQAGSGSGAQSSGSAGNGSAEKADGSVGSGSVAKAEAKDVVVARGDAAKADVNTVVGSNNQSGNGVRNNGSANNGSASKAEEKDVFGARGNGNGSAGNGNAARADLNNVVGSNNQSQSVTGAANAGLAKSNAKDDGIEPDKVGGSVAPKSNQTGSAGAPGKKDGGIQSKGTEASSKNQSVIVSPVVKDQNPTGSGVASSGSSGVVDKQKEATPGPQGSSGSLKDHSAQAVNSKAGNYSAVLVKGNGSPAKEDGNAGGEKNVDWIKEMAGCDIFHGKWVRDDSFPLYPEGSCPHIDEPFNCYLNGRPDRAYEKLRWQPDGCRIPRLKPTDMLERLRGKRLVFVGDSLNRNMWESLVCILWNFVKDKKKVFEASGRREFKTEGSYSFLFTDYNCSVEFFRSPFLVQEWEMPVSKGKKKETLRLDIIERSSPKYKDADFIIFNTGHWWTHEKTSLGKDYYQEGNHVYSELNVVDAFHKALNTWAKWIDANVNPKKTAVFFRGYSASHFSGGQWNSGGSCDKETEPITNENYLSSYPPKMSILEDVIHRMKTPVVYLNITRMTDYRKDAHPSVYRKQHMTEEERRSPERYQDCSHWCLPGVPDSWNELLYAQLLIKQHQMLRQ